MLVPIISADQKIFEERKDINVDDFIQIEKLGKFIDFYNYVPIMMNKIHHKNDTSDDLATFMGKIKLDGCCHAYLDEYEEKDRLKLESESI